MASEDFFRHVVNAVLGYKPLEGYFLANTKKGEFSRGEFIHEDNGDITLKDFDGDQSMVNPPWIHPNARDPEKVYLGPMSQEEIDAAGVSVSASLIIKEKT